MADTNTQPRGVTPRDDAQAQRPTGNNVPPWEYERHLESQHNMMVDTEKGWPTAVKRYRLFRPMEGKRAERTLLVYEGNGPEALAHFFQYVHPAAHPVAHTNAPRPNTYARRS